MFSRKNLINSILVTLFICLLSTQAAFTSENSKSKIGHIFQLLLDPSVCIDSNNNEVDCTEYYLDNDGDGYGISEDSRCLCSPSGAYTATSGGDCNDSNPAVNPGASEDCDDGIDNDCNGNTDADESSCSECVDGYEPNEDSANSYYLGAINEFDNPKTFSMTIYPQGDVDYFRFKAVEGFHACIPLTDQYYVISIQVIPPQGEYFYCNIQLFDDSNNPLEENVTTRVPYTISHTWEGSCGADDSKYFRLRVTGNTGADYCCTSYSVQIDMGQQ